ALVRSADQSEDVSDDQEQAEVGQEDQHEQYDGEDIVLEDDQQPETNDITPEDLDEFILQEKPRFEDIPYDFPSLLERKKGGETWMRIANSIGTSSGVLASAWTKYRKKVKELRNGGAA